MTEEPDEETTVTECDQCHVVGRCTFIPDPYRAEIYPDLPNEPSWWCEGCYREACMEI